MNNKTINEHIFNLNLIKDNLHLLDLSKDKIEQFKENLSDCVNWMIREVNKNNIKNKISPKCLHCKTEANNSTTKKNLYVCCCYRLQHDKYLDVFTQK